MQYLGQVLACLLILLSVPTPVCLNLIFQELYDVIIFHVIVQLVTELSVLLCAQFMQFTNACKLKASPSENEGFDTVKCCDMWLPTPHFCSIE